MNYYELQPENNHFSDVMIDVTHRCNMSCKNCYIPNRKIADLDMNKTIDALAKFPKRTMIRIVGAEPTMRNDLPEFIKRIRKIGHRATMLTNGLRLANDRYCKILKSSKLTHVYLSLNGVDNDDWYEQIDELRCADKKIKALKNLVTNKFLIDTGTIIIKGINDEAISRLLHLYKKVGIVNTVCRIKNIGQLGNYMKTENYTMEELIKLVSEQANISMDHINKWRKIPIYQNEEIEEESFYVPLVEPKLGQLFHRSGIWFKIANWNSTNPEGIPFPNNTRRGRLTENFTIAPFFEHVKNNEFGY